MARDYATSPLGIIRALRRLAPDITVDTVWREDPPFVWDGDGPDPSDEGFVAHDVIVRAEVQALDGETLSGDDGLGGVYEHPGAEPGDVHGYYYQMLAAALHELYQAITGKEAHPGRKAWDPREVDVADPERSEYARQVKAAIGFVDRSAEAIYERQRRRREGI